MDNDNASAAPTAPNDDVADVLLDQVDDTITKIESAKAALEPLEHALEIAEADLERVQEAAAASVKPELVQVYERATEVAEHILNETRTLAETHAKKVAELQNELRTILTELKKLDPDNPLVQKI